MQAQSGGRTGKDFPLKVAPGGTGGRQAKTDGFGGHARQTGPPRIIRADGHHAIRERFAVPIKEQLGLCLEIRFHIVMVVKVILREVRKQRNVELDAVDAELLERVGRDFHHDKIDARVRRAAGFVGISEAELSKSPFDLSGGQKRRAAIAGVIAMEPDVLILDEPTAGLDPAGRESILKNIRDYQAAQHAAVVMVSHSMEEIASNVDRLIVMEKGTAVMTGAPSEVFSHAAELVSMGLNVPCMTQVLLRLQQLGVNVPASAYTVEQAADILEPLLKGGARIC